AAVGHEATPRAPARAHLPLLPSSPGGVQQDDTARGVPTSVTARRPRVRSARGDPAHDTPHPTRTPPRSIAPTCALASATPDAPSRTGNGHLNGLSESGPVRYVPSSIRR